MVANDLVRAITMITEDHKANNSDMKYKPNNDSLKYYFNSKNTSNIDLLQSITE